MKHLKRPFAVLILVFVLATAAPAGDGIIYPWIIPPPPPSKYATTCPDSTGLVGEVNSEDAMVDLVTEIMLRVVQNLLALF